jgi:hypothetical protein
MYTVIGVDVAKLEWDATTYVIGDGRKFTRDRLQKVDIGALVKIDDESAGPQRQRQRPNKKRVVEESTAKVQPQ